MTKKTQSYSELKQELDTILIELQDDATDLDKALELHKNGEVVLKKLESYLAEVSKKIEK